MNSVPVGQPRYRLVLAPIRPVEPSLDHSRRSPEGGIDIGDPVAYAATGMTWNSLWSFQTAQMMRASLLARAVAALLWFVLFSTSRAH